MSSVLRNRLLPENSPKRIGIMNSPPTFITIHETSEGVEVQPESKNYNWYWGLLQDQRSVGGYHFLVEARHFEDARVYQFLQTNVVAYHAGSPEGNAHSLGIERLVNIDTDFEVAIATQAKLAATLMYMYDIPLDHVVPHKYWSGKECPARLLAGMYGGWDGFIKKVKYFFDKHEFIEGIL